MCLRIQSPSKNPSFLCERASAVHSRVPVLPVGSQGKTLRLVPSCYWGSASIAPTAAPGDQWAVVGGAERFHSYKVRGPSSGIMSVGVSIPLLTHLRRRDSHFLFFFMFVFLFVFVIVFLFVFVLLIILC